MVEEKVLLGDLLFVIVLYKTRLYDSLTFKTLRENIVGQSGRADLVAFDNSSSRDFDTVQNVSSMCEEFNINYIWNKSNTGVSPCYNKAAVIGKSMNKKYLVLLDQDSNLPSNLVSIYLYNVNLYRHYPIFVPKLISNSVLYSPCNYRFFRATNIERDIKGGVYTMRKKNVLNSGIMVSLAAFNSVGGYEESVSLYFSDFVFFNKLKKEYTSFIVMDCWIKHNLSSVDYSNKDLALSKFKLYVEGGVAASKIDRQIISFMLYFIALSGRSVLMSTRFKSFGFIKVLIDTYTK